MKILILKMTQRVMIKFSCEFHMAIEIDFKRMKIVNHLNKRN